MYGKNKYHMDKKDCPFSVFKKLEWWYHKNDQYDTDIVVKTQWKVIYAHWLII